LNLRPLHREGEGFISYREMVETAASGKAANLPENNGKRKKD